MELNRKLDSMDYDGLITDLNPPVAVAGRTIAKGSAETTYKRGTIFAIKTSDQKLYPLGTTATDEEFTPDCVLCDDVTVGTAADEKVPVYTAGCFNPEKVSVKSGYTITDADKDALRTRSIVFRAAFPAN